MSKFDQRNQNVSTQLNADKINIELKSITCPNCKQGNPAKAKYCSECGTSLMFKCPLCKSETPLGAKFCSGCGKEIKKIASDIEKANSKRGGSERELAYHIYTGRNHFIARYTLEIDEYVERKEDGVSFYEGDVPTKTADGTLYLTNKNLVFLGRDKLDLQEVHILPIDEITEVRKEIEKVLFISAIYLRIICNGNVRKFGFGRENVTNSWIASINESRK